MKTRFNATANSLKKLIIFFKIKPSLGINNNIISRMNISISKNTESFDITKFLLHSYTINNANILSDILDLINKKRLIQYQI